ncbi:MAG: FkbM family methyltransferase [Imperialibacter sp.]|uniref:FkbM family methyltransferase n=1 Tax=Imperialibacter sp. TaxID=2038411 RepID=UPI0030DCF9AF|tara:strand:- start:182 stop:886 length:705 start_codon:yes stop_codon:yes gene_type:complete
MQWHIFTGLPDNSWKPATARLQKSNAQNHLHVFDVGANCGAFTLKLAAWCYKKGLSHVTIHAFEPNPNVVQVLTENIELNPTLKSIIQIHPFGLGAANEMIPFHSNEENSGAGTFSGFGKAVLGELMIRRMDDVVSDIKSGVVFFLKIDVEGFEPDVLMGAQQTISKFKPGIYIEMTDQWFREKGSSSLKILNYFWELGYDVFLDADRHFEPIGKDNHDRLNTLFQYNVLAELN